MDTEREEKNVAMTLQCDVQGEKEKKNNSKWRILRILHLQ